MRTRVTRRRGEARRGGEARWRAVLLAVLAIAGCNDQAIVEAAAEPAALTEPFEAMYRLSEEDREMMVASEPVPAPYRPVAVDVVEGRLTRAREDFDAWVRAVGAAGARPIVLTVERVSLDSNGGGSFFGHIDGRTSEARTVGEVRFPPGFTCHDPLPETGARVLLFARDASDASALEALGGVGRGGLPNWMPVVEDRDQEVALPWGPSRVAELMALSEEGV